MLSNRTVNVGDSAFDVTVSGKFSDLDNDTLTFSASSSDTSVATVSVSSGTLTVTPKTGGTTTITVTASDGRLTVSLSFTITVTDADTENEPPTVSWSIPDQPMERNGSSVSVILTNKFSDPDGDRLSYSATSSDTSVATVSVSGSTLSITPGVNGTSTVTVIATDPGGLTASQTPTATGEPYAGDERNHSEDGSGGKRSVPVDRRGILFLGTRRRSAHLYGGLFEFRYSDGDNRWKHGNSHQGFSRGGPGKGLPPPTPAA